MSEINNDEIKSILYDISKSIILPKFQKLKNEDIKIKNNTDLVTSVDIEVEKKLKKILLSLLPNSLFVGEESFFEDPNIIQFYKQNNFVWTVDPIDGTSNFVKGKDKFAIMIGLTFKQKILQSWIYKPISDEFCYSKLSEGSFINDSKIYFSKDSNAKKSIGSISSKYWENGYYDKIIKIRNAFKNVNSYGCIGFEYVDIAKGDRDFAILSRLSPWDHIPGILLVKESGGSIVHFDKSEYNHTIIKNNLIVTHSHTLQNEIIQLIER